MTMKIATRPVKRYGQADLGPGLKMWRRVTAVLSDDTGEIPFTIRLAAGLEGGRMVVESLCLEKQPGGPAITGEALRAVQVASLLRFAVWDQAELDDQASRLMQSEPAIIKERGKSDEALKAVSLAYRLAYLSSEPPRKKVMEMLETSRATATRWISAAVERGFLDAGLAGRTIEED